MPVTIPGLPEPTPASRINGGPTTAEFFDFFFSDNAGMPAQSFDQFIQWDVTGGSVDFVGGVGPGVFGAPPDQDTGRYVDLGGSTGDPGRFETRLSFPMIAGQTYNLTFDYRSTGGDKNRATVTVTVGDQTFTVVSRSTEFQRFSMDFVATATMATTIAFQGDERDTDGSGIGIDGILFGTVLQPENPDETIIASPNPNHLEGGDGNDTLVGSMFDDRLSGGTGNDTVQAGMGNDLIIGDAGADALTGDAGIDTVTYMASTAGVRVDLVAGGLRGDAQRDTYSGIENVMGSRFADTLIGDAAANRLIGGGGDDLLRGGGGVDFLIGGEGDDTIEGGAGSDRLSGGTGADTFAFGEIDGRDRIGDFDAGAGDRIDLRRLDARADLGGNQAFAFIGEDRFSGTAGELRVVFKDGFAVVSGDVDGDRIGDFSVRLDGVTAIDASAFLL